MYKSIDSIVVSLNSYYPPRSQVHNMGAANGCRYPDPVLFVMYWIMVNFFIGIAVNIYVFQKERGRMRGWLIDMHLVLNIAGFVLYTFLGSALVFWAYRYKFFMFTSERRTRIVLGIAISFAIRDFPCTILELKLFWDAGWVNPLQFISFIFICLNALLGVITIWLEYSWRISYTIEKKYDDSRYSWAQNGEQPPGQRHDGGYEEDPMRYRGGIKHLGYNH